MSFGRKEWLNDELTSAFCPFSPPENDEFFSFSPFPSSFSAARRLTRFPPPSDLLMLSSPDEKVHFLVPL